LQNWKANKKQGRGKESALKFEYSVSEVVISKVIHCYFCNFEIWLSASCFSNFQCCWSCDVCRDRVWLFPSNNNTV